MYTTDKTLIPDSVKSLLDEGQFKRCRVDRAAVRAKFNNRCAYCGVILTDRFQVDHVEPKSRGGTDDLNNLNPACQRCNNRKGVLSIEEFRYEIQQQVARLRRDSSGFRLASDFGIITETGSKVEFFFELELVND